MTTVSTAPGPAAPPPVPVPAAREVARARRLDSVRHSLVLAERTLVKIRRTPEQLIDVTLQPILFVLLFVYLFGGAIAGSQHDYLQFVLPAIMVQTVLFSAMVIGSNLNGDITKGVFDRFRSLPISRAAPLVGAVLGDVVRYLISIVVILVLGTILGFRVQTDPAQALAACVLLVAFALCLTWVSVLIGMLVHQAGAVQGISFLVLMPLTFGSSMFVPTDTLPGWLRAYVHVNPVTHLVDAVRGLMLGGDVTTPLLWSLGWGAALLGIFAPLAVRAYRLRA